MSGEYPLKASVWNICAETLAPASGLPDGVEHDPAQNTLRVELLHVKRGQNDVDRALGGVSLAARSSGDSRRPRPAR